MATPVPIPRYLQLAVKTDLDRRQIRQFIAAVRRAAPSGVLTTVQTVDDQGSRASVCLVHQAGQTLHRYKLPLTRDLLPNEVQRIVAAYAAVAPDLDFDVETSETRFEPTEAVGINDADTDQIARGTALAKAGHATWMHDRLAAGWRFGIRFSTQAKTHPLLRPWEQLPDRFRQPDLAA